MRYFWVLLSSVNKGNFRLSERVTHCCTHCQSGSGAVHTFSCASFTTEMNVIWAAVLFAAMFAAINADDNRYGNTQDLARQYGFGNRSPSSGGGRANMVTNAAAQKAIPVRGSQPSNAAGYGGPAAGVSGARGYGVAAGGQVAMKDSHDGVTNLHGGDVADFDGNPSDLSPTTVDGQEDDPAHRKQVLQGIFKRVSDWARTQHPDKPVTAGGIDEKQQHGGGDGFDVPHGKDQQEVGFGGPSGDRPDNEPPPPPPPSHSNRMGSPPTPPSRGGGRGGPPGQNGGQQPGGNRGAPNRQPGGRGGNSPQQSGGGRGGNSPQQPGGRGGSLGSGRGGESPQQPGAMQHDDNIGGGGAGGEQGQYEDQYQGW